MFVDEIFYYKNCKRCNNNERVDENHVLCTTPYCERLNKYVAAKAKEKEDQKNQGKQ